MHCLPLRLGPGADLRTSLESATRGLSAFVLCGIGSLSGARLRLAGAEAETVLPGDVEILSLSGTLTPDGAHLHMAVADAQGVVSGGHVGYGNTVRTTVELLLAQLPEWPLAREHDRRTGYKELVVHRPTLSGAPMFDHVLFGVSDYAASKAFFLQALAPLGVEVVQEGPLGLELSADGKSSLCICQTDEKPAHLHVAFRAENRGQVDAFHRAALAVGGQDHGAPGLRPQYHANYYAAFVIGPDGHNIEVVCHEAEA